MQSELQDESPTGSEPAARRSAKRGRTMLIVSAATIGAALGGAGIANAATSSTASTPSTAATGSTATRPDPAEMTHGPGETLLTGTTAEKVKAAALTADPGATIIRVETDSAGSPYEAHITKADGTHVTLKINANFKVTATDSGFGGGPGGRGPGERGPGGRRTRRRSGRRSGRPGWIGAGRCSGTERLILS